ncbi:hypothetical protein [Desulfovibrio ferrophilus]|uniref:Uncharacterized protein n=1 Tax=Desulfovibrio ferrophilus TaxID=241368 RepID=A0A2Z6B3F6_9BACT|nr:hypothetical protein [Desulfovibrio ferrophilus]BBD10032.1 uncharacterized protein DFE_3306 [Desulfovibrio ferrophilus]
MSTAINIQNLAEKAECGGVALEAARLCTVCWTVHDTEDCPECRARQWLYLAPLLRGFDDIGVSDMLRQTLLNKEVEYRLM